MVAHMAKATHKQVKFTPEEMAYELPSEIDVGKLRNVGHGADAVRKLAARSKRVVGLDPDVAKVFSDSESVNRVLRAIIEHMPSVPVRAHKRSA
jgi:hypothetical protein